MRFIEKLAYGMTATKAGEPFLAESQVVLAVPGRRVSYSFGQNRRIRELQVPLSMLYKRTSYEGQGGGASGGFSVVIEINEEAVPRDGLL